MNLIKKCIARKDELNIEKKEREKEASILSFIHVHWLRRIIMKIDSICLSSADGIHFNHLNLEPFIGKNGKNLSEEIDSSTGWSNGRRRRRRGDRRIRLGVLCTLGMISVRHLCLFVCLFVLEVWKNDFFLVSGRPLLFTLHFKLYERCLKCMLL